MQDFQVSKEVAITGKDDLFERPTMQRLFCAVGHCNADANGNVHSAEVAYLDRVGCDVKWVSWEPGHVLHWHPFKLRLNSTTRAGLHVTCEWRTDTDEMRYGSNFKIRDSGIFVLNPSNVMTSGEKLSDALNSREETSLITRVLRMRFGLLGGCNSLLKLELPDGALEGHQNIRTEH